MAESSALTRRVTVQGHKAFLRTLDDNAQEKLVPFSDGKFKEVLAAEYPEIFKTAEVKQDLIRESLEATSLSARGRLVKEIGKEAADAHARRFGLRDATDLRPGTGLTFR
jgi:hypothetical protein